MNSTSQLLHEAFFFTHLRLNNSLLQSRVHPYIFNGILLSHKKNEIMPFAATWMDPEIVILSEVRERHISYVIAYMWNLKKGYKRTYLQNRNRVTDEENKLMVTRGFGGV